MHKREYALLCSLTGKNAEFGMIEMEGVTGQWIGKRERRYDLRNVPPPCCAGEARLTQALAGTGRSPVAKLGKT